MKSYKDISPSVLEAIDTPKVFHEIKVGEFTFLGDHNQPDFGTIKIVIQSEKGVELKSLKKYLYQYRDVRLSYERAVEVLYNHLNEVYSPESLSVELSLNPRGGISSKVTKFQDIDLNQSYITY